MARGLRSVSWQGAWGPSLDRGKLVKVEAHSWGWGISPRMLSPGWGMRSGLWEDQFIAGSWDIIVK